jgi:phosphatidylinositol-3,4,5-trisphosphate 3-phosphatase/dual-specificity protein phosphatase PTEN
MAEFLRRLVSGGKARFKDPNLDLELDLAYVTDQVIVMGYPAAGIEGLYRNRREDAQRFLTARHGSDFWVFNFCPVRENFYDKSVFGGRVSRYPFPDHHAPPLAILPLVSREIHAWVTVSKDRVAVLHCKAGKGRSGTLVCAYLLSLDTFSPPVENSYPEKDWVTVRVEDCMQVIPDDAALEELEEAAVSSASSIVEEKLSEPRDESRSIPSKPSVPMLQQVLDLHTSRRMKASSISTNTSNTKPRAGVSIPSQRRWLLYWSQLLAGEGPPGMWGLSGMKSGSHDDSNPPPILQRKVRITEISLRLRELFGIKVGLVRAANMLMDRGKDGRGLTDSLGNNRVWASLARYDDDLVNALERWEQSTRDITNLGRRKHKSSESVSGIFTSDKWDKEKMVRTFARMGDNGKLPSEMNSKDESIKVYSYVLSPLTEECWVEISKAPPQEETHSSEASVKSGMNSIHSISRPVTNARIGRSGIVVDAHRELRIKIYMGQVFMTWLWFIPAFHISLDTPSSSFTLRRDDLDFPIGIGKGIMDVELKMEWCQDVDDMQVETTRTDSPSSGVETVVASIAGGVEVGQAVER